MFKMLLRGRVLCGTLCQLFSLIFISFSFSSKVDAAPVVTVHIANAAFFQNEHPVTLTGNGIPLRAVFKAIKKQTGYAVMYSTSATALNQDEKVTVNFKETPLDDVLGTLFKGRNLEWQYSEDVLLIRKKEAVMPKKSEVDSVVTPVALTGKVTDATGQPLPGVTIQVKGKNLGTTSDSDGRFSLPQIGIGEVLMMSSVGFEKREIVVKGKNVLVEMSLQVGTLDETVVIAYGTTTQRLSTGNTATIRSKEIEKQPVSNPLLTLQGRIPGLFITQATGTPGSGITVRVQGQNSLSRGSDPLYVIDGVPYTSQLLSNISGPLGVLGSSGNTNPYDQAGGGNPLSFINPADIESIDVLKDADATAIYGSRAANGAILITTKKGKAGQTKTDITIQNGWGKITRKMNLLNTQQYLAIRHEAFRNDGVPPGFTDYDINGVWDTTRYTDWQKELIGKVAHYTNAQASISGGNVNTQFLIGAGYHRETTVLPGNPSDKKGSLHFNITNRSLNEKFCLQLSGSYLADDNQLSNVDFTPVALHLSPNAPALYNSDGSLNWENSTWQNPIALFNNKYNSKTTNLLSNALISYKILPGLDIKTSIGYTHLQTNETSINPLISYAPEKRATSTRYSEFANNAISSWIIEPQITYKHAIKKGILEVLAGTTFLQNNRNGQRYFGFGFNSDQVMEDIKAAASIVAILNTITKYRYNALFGRINYNWRNKYIVNFTARRDGSSRFGLENSFHNFGSVAGSWLFTNEGFISRNLDFLSFGKLRASYGITGNDQIGDYQFMNLYNTVSVPVAYQGATGLSPAGLPNQHLQWEETRKLQVGLDIGFLKDRVLLNVNYYHNRSSNQLQAYALPIITGNYDIQLNFPATVQNTGWEFSINTTNINSNDWHWNSNINLTIPKNKLIAYPDLITSSYANSYVIGQPITILKAYHLSGVDPNNGIYQFTDNQGKPTPLPDYFSDRTALVNTDPVYYGGIQNNIRYKGFELDILFQYVNKTSFDYTLGNLPGYFKSDGMSPVLANQPTFILQRWQKEGDVKPTQKFSATYPSPLLYGYFNAVSSNASYSNSSYIRLKNLSVSWRIPRSWKKIACIQNSRLFIQGQNLLTITSYKGMDPENATTSNLPPLKVLTLGIQVVLQ